MNRNVSINQHFLKLLLVFECLIILSIISCFRLLGIGADYNNYVEAFSNRSEQLEPAYSLLRTFIDYFNISVWFIYFFSVMISLYLKSYAINALSRNFCLVFLFYCLSFYFLHEYIQIRASVAIGLFFISIKDLIRERDLNYFVKMIIALCFHYSAIIMIPCWLYSKFKSKTFFVFFTLLTFVSAVFLSIGFRNIVVEYIYLIQIQFGIYKSGSESDILTPFNFKYLIMLLLFLYFSTVVKKSNIVDYTLYKIYSFGICCFYFFILLYFPVMAVRFAEFNTAVVAILFTNLMYNYPKRSLVRYLHFMLGILFFVFYGYSVLRTTNLL